MKTVTKKEQLEKLYKVIDKKQKQIARLTKDLDEITDKVLELQEKKALILPCGCLNTCKCEYR